MGAAAAGMAWLIHQEVDSPILLQVLGFSGGLFIACMVCHGELARLKPAPDRLTSYYLTMAAGGAAGGVLVAVAAPLVLRTYLELPLAIWASAALAVLAFWHEQPAGQRWRQRWAGPLFAAEGLAALGLLAFVLKEAAPSLVGDALPPTRNFYGVLRVTAYNEDDPDCARYCLRHGRICHGTQFTSEERRRRPTSYYGESSGVGLALVALQDRPDLRVGVVGLGVGTLAAYGRPGDTYRFYEINPAVRHLATSLFTYLGDSAARCEVAMGDARLSLEREPPQRFDLLALDAFTSDAIPVHLLTREAFEVYFRHLRPGGVLAVHVSNRYLDLEPVILALAAHFQRAAVVIESKEDAENEIDPATWVLVTDDRALLDAEPIQNAASGQTYRTGPRYLWTDNYSNLLSVLH
jgi:SAM-dependent methyltransferase